LPADRRGLPPPPRLAGDEEPIPSLDATRGATLGFMTKTFCFTLLLAMLCAGSGACSSGGDTPGPGQPLRVKQLASGYPDFYGLLSDGTVVRWGFADDNLASTPASRVPGLEGVVDISGEFGTFCALLATGRVKCWGRGDFGQLGEGSSGDGHESAVPVEVVGLTDAVDIDVSVSASYACAARKTGAVVCWGRNDEATLGFTSALCGPYPRQISDNEFVDDYFPCEASPRAIEGVTGAVSIAVGEGYQCSLDAAGAAACWGAFRGPQGDLAKPVEPPAPVGSLGPSKKVSVGQDHACALLGDDRVACWGDNAQGQLGLGDGAGVSSSAAAVVVPGLEHAAGLLARFSVTCAPRQSGKISCWGSVGSIINPEDLGLAADGVVTSPVDLPRIDDAVELVVRQMSCFRRFDDSVRCWPNWGLPLAFLDVTW
jgi:hypothetical protein